MRPCAVQTGESDFDELRGRGRSGVRQRTLVVPEILVVNQGGDSVAVVHHVLRHLLRVHRDHCQ